MNGALILAVSSVWCGMVAAISFMEAPLKFKAPGITRQLGVGIGRLVFGALNRVEVVFSLATVALIVFNGFIAASVAALAASGTLLIQLALIRPMLRRQSERVLAGEASARTSSHLWYVAAEVVKFVALSAAIVLAIMHIASPA